MIVGYHYYLTAAPQGDEPPEEACYRGPSLWRDGAPIYRWVTYCLEGSPFDDFCPPHLTPQECMCELYTVCGNGDCPPGAPCNDYGDEEEDIENKLKNPCLFNTVNGMLNGSPGINNVLINFVHSTFGNSAWFDIHFKESASLPDSDDGYCQPLSVGNAIRFEVVLNVNKLPNASKEYVVATVLHEIVHAYINLQGLNGIYSNNHHLFPQFFAELTSSLVSMFPSMSPQLAADLTWGGLYTSLRFQSLSPQEQQRIMAVNTAHRSGNVNGVGTPCN